MRLKLTSTDTGSASASGMISRRSFMGATAAIATVPAVAVAETLAKSDRLPRSLESQLDDCVAALKTVLQEMYPECDYIGVRKDDLGAGFMLWICGRPTAEVNFTGEGFYEIRASQHCPAGNFWVQEVWSEEVQRKMLRGSFMFEGHRVGPSELIEPWQLVRKLTGGEA